MSVTYQVCLGGTKLSWYHTHTNLSRMALCLTSLILIDIIFEKILLQLFTVGDPVLLTTVKLSNGPDLPIADRIFVIMHV